MPEVLQGALALGRRLLAQALDLLARAHVGFRQRAFDRGGVSLHEIRKLVGLAREPIQRPREVGVAALQRLVDLVVGRFQRVGGAQDCLALVLETAGDAGELPEQVMRDVLQDVGLVGHALHGLNRLARDVLAGAPYRVDAVHQGLVEVGRLPPNGAAEANGVLVERLGEGLRLFDDGGVDRRRGAHDRLVEQAQPLGEGIVQRLRALDELIVERLRAVGESGVEGARIFLEDGLQRFGAVAEGGIEPLQLRIEARLQLLGAAAECGGEPGGVGLEQALQLIGAPAHGRFKVVDAGSERRFERGQVVACPLDDLRQLDLLVRQLVDQRGDLPAEPIEALVNAVAGVDEGVALARQLLDERAHLALVLLVGALQKRHLIVHHRLELAGASERARDGVVHEGDLAAHGLAQRGDLLLGDAIGLGEPDGHLGHGRRPEAQLLRAPGEQGEQP